MSDDRQVLKLPDTDHVEYQRNFVRTAVCELRFPTLLELEVRPPDALQKALRREYPIYERAQAVTGITVGATGTEQQVQVQHHFQSKDRKWTVLFRSSAVALESTEYGRFEDFQKRLTWVLKAVKSIIDADFFTRIGLRYINTLPFKSGPDFEGWLNPVLSGPLVNGPYGSLSTFWQQAQGFTERGNFSFRHGLSETEKELRYYVLDFDFYEENIDFQEAEDVVAGLHETGYKFFRWAVGPKTLEAMGQPVKKGSK